MNLADLERVADRALRALPTPRAPRTLLPRVLAAITAEAVRPWYTRAWLTWPLRWQFLSAVTAVVMVVTAMLIGPSIAPAMVEYATRVSLPLSSSVSAAMKSLQTFWDASRILWSVVEPIARYLAILLLLMSAACVAFGTALDRVIALGGASES